MQSRCKAICSQTMYSPNLSDRSEFHVNRKYLDLKTLDVVIANPDVLAVVGIWHILRGIPSLSGSLRQEGTDLKRED